MTLLSVHFFGRFDLLVHQSFAFYLFNQGNGALAVRDLPRVIAEIELV